MWERNAYSMLVSDTGHPTEIRRAHLGAKFFLNLACDAFID